MIDFTNIEKRNVSYEICYIWVWYAFNKLFFRNFEIKGKENIPDEPFLIICNHQNGLIDAMLPVFGIPNHRMVFIARGDIFKKDKVAKILKWCRVLPAFRVRDTGKENLGENDKIFELAANILNNGKIVGLFPEAALQYDRSMGSFKKGFARIAFRAEEIAGFNLHLKILPMANYYENFYSAGHSALLNIGKPFEFGELLELYREHPEAAYRQLALKAQEHVRPLMLDIADKENNGQLDALREIYREFKYGKRARRMQMSERLVSDQTMLENFRKLKEEKPEKFAWFMEKTKSYSDLLGKLNFRNWLIGKSLGLFAMVLLSLLSLVFAPFYAVLWLLNIVPYKLPELVVKKLKDKRMSASMRLGIGAVATYPVWNLLLFGLSFIIPWPWWCSLIFLALLTVFPILFIALRHWFVKFYHRWRYFAKQGSDSETLEAIALKAEIFEEFK
ncbi:MAG: 1-acyl-sn-glycerol-3-phosphate acyltransferase, partial [Bacteroidales bacterium]|nr:1-acyl-sn-glycerol-3-phosphate acyltransferase [Bacteroidales bacterium]